MNKKIGILTYHHVLNDGAILQAYSQAMALQSYFSNYKVEIIDYRMKVREIKDILKTFSSFVKWTDPINEVKRYYKFKKFINKELPLSVDRLISDDYGKAKKFINNKYDVICVGSDEVWKITEDKFSRPFPNIYWLDPEINCKKIGLAASANKLNPEYLDIDVRKKIEARLNSFDLIGVRDSHTLEFVKSMGVNSNKVSKVPDPTLTYSLNEQFDLSNKLEKIGLDLNEPIVAIILSSGKENKSRLSQRVYKYFKKRKCQVVSLSMYNKYADYNLTGQLNPFEWAHVFKYFTFCITDRFHGTIFSIKNGIPFLTVDHEDFYLELRSKTYDILEDLSLLSNHIHIQDINNLEKLIERAEVNFEQNKVDNQLEILKNYYFDFIKKIDGLIQE